MSAATVSKILHANIFRKFRIVAAVTLEREGTVHDSGRSESAVRHRVFAIRPMGYALRARFDRRFGMDVLGWVVLAIVIVVVVVLLVGWLLTQRRTQHRRTEAAHLRTQIEEHAPVAEQRAAVADETAAKARRATAEADEKQAEAARLENRAKVQQEEARSSRSALDGLSAGNPGGRAR